MTVVVRIMEGNPYKMGANLTSSKNLEETVKIIKKAMEESGCIKEKEKKE